HAHNLEFVQYNGQFMLDLMRDHTNHLGFEVDVHWIWRAGLNPIDIILKYANRIRAIHLKDYRVGEIDMSQYPCEGHEKIYYMLHMIIQLDELGNVNIPIIEIM